MAPATKTRPARLAPARAPAAVTVAPPGRAFRVAVLRDGDWTIEPMEYLSRGTADAHAASLPEFPDVRVILRPVGWTGQVSA